MMKNARQNLECSIQDLNHAKESLEQALSTVEKSENKQNIQNSLTAIESALSKAQSSIDNYVER